MQKISALFCELHPDNYPDCIFQHLVCMFHLCSKGSRATAALIRKVTPNGLMVKLRQMALEKVCILKGYEEMNTEALG